MILVLMHGCALVIEESADCFEECLEDAWEKEMKDLAIDMMTRR